MCVCVCGGLKSSETGWRDEERGVLVSRRQRTAGEEIGRPARHAVIMLTLFPRQPCHLCVCVCVGPFRYQCIHLNPLFRKKDSVSDDRIGIDLCLKSHFVHYKMHIFGS